MPTVTAAELALLLPKLTADSDEDRIEAWRELLNLAADSEDNRQVIFEFEGVFPACIACLLPEKGEERVHILMFLYCLMSESSAQAAAVASNVSLVNCVAELVTDAAVETSLLLTVVFLKLLQDASDEAEAALIATEGLVPALLATITAEGVSSDVQYGLFSPLLFVASKVPAAAVSLREALAGSSRVVLMPLMNSIADCAPDVELRGVNLSEYAEGILDRMNTALHAHALVAAAGDDASTDEQAAVEDAINAIIESLPAAAPAA